MDIAFAAFVAASLGEAKFVLLDLGCSGGLDPRWRAFGSRLKALAVDASSAECERLRAAETNRQIEYLAAFVSHSTDAPIDIGRGQASPLIFRIRDRLSMMRTLELRATRLGRATTEEKLRHNTWEKTRLADPAKPVVALDLLAGRGWSDFDYLKIDIDGSD